MSAPVDYRYTSILWAGPEISADLSAMHKGLFPETWDAGSFEKLLSHPGSIAFFARVGAPPQMAGFIVAQMAADEAEILTLGVPVAHQRHGLARKLVDALVRAARKSEVKKLFLEVGAQNAPALALYAKAGFQKAAVRKGYYVHPGKPPEDAVVMVLQL